MKHPAGNCDRCGHRLYAHATGGTFCANCGDGRDRRPAAVERRAVAED